MLRRKFRSRTARSRGCEAAPALHSNSRRFRPPLAASANRGAACIAQRQRLRTGIRTLPYLRFLLAARYRKRARCAVLRRPTAPSPADRPQLAEARLTHDIEGAPYRWDLREELPGGVERHPGYIDDGFIPIFNFQRLGVVSRSVAGGAGGIDACQEQVPNGSEDLPEPDTPMNTTRASRGVSTCAGRRLRRLQRSRVSGPRFAARHPHGVGVSVSTRSRPDSELLSWI